MKLETIRLATTIAFAQCPIVFLTIIAFEARGTAAALLAFASFLTMFIAGMAVTFFGHRPKCPACGDSYFSTRTALFMIARRCNNCSVKEGDPPGSYWRGL